MPWTNYHSHSHFCDGVAPPEEHIQAAIEKDFLAFGCSSHAYVPFEQSWSIKKDRLQEYKEEILRLKESYADQIEVYYSFEVDYIPGMIGPNGTKQEFGLDYTVGSVHFADSWENGKPWGIDGKRQGFVDGIELLFDQSPERAVSRYYELIRQMLEEDCPEVLGHMDKVKMHNSKGVIFEETEKWYREAVMATLETARSTEVIIELNTRGLYKKKTFEPYPSKWILEAIYDMGIPLMINSDSHHPREIDAHFSDSAKLLREIGFRELRILLNGEWQDRAFDEKGFRR
ncbi:MAG: histidinol-phosphatase [Bacteroidota bacterium]